jgi:hypothetical protein
VFYQAPDSYEGLNSSVDQKTTDDENVGPEWQHQYSNLLEALAAAGACSESSDLPHELPFDSEGHNIKPQPSTPTAAEPFGSLFEPESPVQLGAATYLDVNKENAAPSTTPGQRSQKMKSLASELLEKARLSIKKIPPKPTLEETLVQVQRYDLITVIASSRELILYHATQRENLKHQQNRADEELNIKKRTLLMEEFKAGLWDRDEYRQRVTALESDKATSESPTTP